jgi:hypothetical protein
MRQPAVSAAALPASSGKAMQAVPVAKAGASGKGRASDGESFV